MGDSNSMRDGVIKKVKPKKIELEPKLTSLDKDALQVYEDQVKAFVKGQPHLKIRPETIELQFVSKCLNANGDELCILPHEGKLHQFKLQKTTLNESVRKNLLEGTREYTEQKKQLALVCLTTNEVVAVRINPPKAETIKAPSEIFSINNETDSCPTRRNRQRTISPPPDIIVISDDENHLCPNRRDPQTMKIKEEPGVNITQSTRNKRNKKK